LFAISVLLYLLAFLAVLSDVLIVYQILRERKLYVKYDGSLPSASVIIPIRGVDDCLEENVKALLSQEYPEYEVIYVVDDDEKELAKMLSSLGAKVVTSSMECEECSGKIRAQLTGLRTSKGEVIVFGDSDTRYDKSWLKTLVGGLEKFDAVTTYPWPKCTRLSLRNLIRAGFWTLGFESQFSDEHRFLWGGSMAFRREFLMRPEVQRELSMELCDDCTLTRLIKNSRGKIGFSMNAMPLNIFNEKNLISWSSRQLITIRKYSPKGAEAYLIIGSLFLLFLFLSPMEPILFTPYLLWIVKNLIRGRKYGKDSIIPSLMTIISIPYALVLLLYNWNRQEVMWRDKKYVMKDR